MIRDNVLLFPILLMRPHATQLIDLIANLYLFDLLLVQFIFSCNAIFIYLFNAYS